ncbi:hypothetical protein BDV26DRAFT_268804 [Aspergillus bertholletiae]|uniref:Uncharacterized protein n=1 Tax=Aspergillus bertholletiae TaxID=1226010 RepID=A0A5N7AYZ7_9EURO|nr:hypothetical protein BDV26DRAFT_268804 [Aspergillus bertholletiae]
MRITQICILLPLSISHLLRYQKPHPKPKPLQGHTNITTTRAHMHTPTLKEQAKQTLLGTKETLQKPKKKICSKSSEKLKSSFEQELQSPEQQLQLQGDMAVKGLV